MAEGYLEVKTMRGEMFSHETNDCTVVALSELLSIEYLKAHDILRYLGRKDREGFNSAILLEFLREHHEVKVVTPPQSVWLLRCKAHTYPGKYLVRCQDFKTGKGHAFVILDGKITDTSASHLRITGMWEVN
jgi:hypothetical protein